MSYKSTHPREGIHSNTSFILGTIENTNLAIGGFLAGLHRSLLTFLFAFSGFTNSLKINNARDFQPTDFRRTIKRNTSHNKFYTISCYWYSHLDLLMTLLFFYLPLTTCHIDFIVKFL